MLVIGLTGGIGSGKTAASDYFAEKGITIVDADLASRVVVEPGKPALADIAQHFGNGIIASDGTLDRAVLRTIVFKAPEERVWLEKLLHPLIAAEILAQIEASQSEYTILVSPILFETGQNLMAQRTLVVDAPENLQISRTAARDNTDQESVKAIMKVQAERESRIQKADDIITNDGDLAHLHQQIDDMHEYYLTLANRQAKSKD